jgi:hypothetical protein
MTVFAVDPGPHTGIFYQDAAGVHTEMLDLRGAINPHQQLYMWLMSHVNPATDKVVCESFEFRKDDAQTRSYIDYSTGELVGAVALFCQLTETVHVRQMAAQGKGFWNDEKLRRVGLWVGGPDAKHMRDATRHWLHYHCFGRGMSPEVANYWFSRLRPLP